MSFDKGSRLLGLGQKLDRGGPLDLQLQEIPNETTKTTTARYPAHSFLVRWSTKEGSPMDAAAAAQ